MRIISGKFRGRKLFVPRGLDVRPTADRVKEAVFSILGGQVAGARVIDLFAGSGALGLEALSRGAVDCVFVDGSARSLAAVKRNLEALGLDGPRLIKADLAGSWKPLDGLGSFDLIFMDPPYRSSLIPQVLAKTARRGLAADEAMAMAEHAAGVDLGGAEPEWRFIQSRKYGDTQVSFFQVNVQEPGTRDDG